MIEIVVPRQGMYDGEVVIVAVEVTLGDRVAAQQLLVEVETGKVTSEISADTAGVVIEILVKAGDVVKVGDVVARIDGG
jgi:pyruvate/2-oxoglutarate dehydrogenase complex dihydrolipoamide acyltransferase (E2) component